MLGRQKSDIELRSRATGMLLLTLLAAQWLIILANGAVVPNEQMNELEKATHNIGRQQQQAANDLLEQPEVGVETKQQQQQAQKLVSQGVINGNHATYVEPPADFKPIIYDYERQHNQNQRQQQQPANGTKIDTLSGESLDVPNQLSNSIGGNSQQQQQQQQQSQPQSQRQNQQTDPLMISSSGSNSEFAALDAHRRQQQPSVPLPADELPMKPSIGRWSDWHDMSIEPDLASSDTQQAASFFYTLQQRAAVPQSAPFRTRKQPIAGSTKTSPSGWSQVQQQQLPPQVVPLSEGQKLEQSAPIGGQKIESMTAGEQLRRTSELEQAQQEQQQQQRQALKIAQSGSSSQAQDAQVKGSPRLALNWLINSPSSFLIKMQQQQQNELNQSNQLQASPPPNGWHLLTAGKSLQAANNGDQPQIIQKQQRQLHHPQQLQRRLKRRRKSKTNAEVRIQQLVAASQQQQQELLSSTKQVNGLAAANYQVSQQGQQLERQPKEHLMSFSGDRTGDPMLQANDKVLQVSQRVPGKPAVFIKRMGSYSSSPSKDPHFSANSSSAAQRRAVKRRRVKTLLPVGLSSWFLGGIRDLDGRHWQLPSEVIGRLAINDIDFSPQPPKMLPPAVGSVVIVGLPEGAESWQQPPVVLATQQPQHRVPINQLIPR